MLNANAKSGVRTKNYRYGIRLAVQHCSLSCSILIIPGPEVAKWEVTRLASCDHMDKWSATWKCDIDPTPGYGTLGNYVAMAQ